MKLAVSNISLPAFEHESALYALPGFGIQGLEVAPSRVWQDTWKGLTGAQVAAYRQQVEAAGLGVAGLHSLLFDHPELALFRDAETRAETLEFMVHLSGVCRDLGGKTLIWGGGRNREGMAPDRAREVALEFLAALGARIADHGTLFCFEPLGPKDSDFINKVSEAVEIVDTVGHPSLGIQIDAKALVDNDEAEQAVFDQVAGRLDHFHANEPGLDVLGRTGRIDHASMGAALRAIGYEGFVSIEQRMLDAERFLEDVRESAAGAHRNYGTTA